MQLLIPPIETYHIRRSYIARIHHTSIVHQGLQTDWSIESDETIESEKLMRLLASAHYHTYYCSTDPSDVTRN